MLRRLYDHVIRLAGTRWALPALMGLAFCEAVFLPIPPDTLLAPMVLARRERAWGYAAVCTACSVTGGLFNYGLGYFLGQGAVHALHAEAGFAKYQAAYQHWGVWVILAKGLTPIPFMVVTLLSGVFRFNLLAFALAALATRGARFFLEAALLQHPQAKAFVERHVMLLAGLAAALLAAAIAATRLL